MTTTSPGTMRRWVFQAGGHGVDGLSLQEAPIPVPGPGQIRVRMQAASLNFRDQLLLIGQYGSTDEDIVPLSDGVGEVDALGDDVQDIAVGDIVSSLYYPAWRGGAQPAGLGLGPGTAGDPGMLAEYVVLDAHAVTAAPASLTPVETSTLACAGVTAWTALQGDQPYFHPITAGDKVLILGSGGVSLIALGLARAVGAEVFATSSSDDKLERTRELGAAGTVNYRTTPDWGRAVFELTGGVDRVINAAGSAAMDQSIVALANDGEIALMGFMNQADGAPDFIALMSKGASIRGTRVGSAGAHADLTVAIDAGAVKPPIHQVFAFEDAVAAYRAQTSREVFGKVVIEIGG